MCVYIRSRLQFQFSSVQNFRRVLYNFLLVRLRHCEDYSEQSKLYFEPLKPFAKLACLLNLRILTLFATFSLSIFDFGSLHFHYNSVFEEANLSLTILKTRLSIFVQLLFG